MTQQVGSNTALAVGRLQVAEISQQAVPRTLFDYRLVA